MNLEKIRSLVENRAGGLRKLATDINMSEANLHRCINNNKIQAGDLEKISIQLGVDIRVFFDDVLFSSSSYTCGDFSPAVSGVHGSVTVNATSESDTIQKERIFCLQEKIKHLEEMLSEKERTISILLSSRSQKF